MKKLPPNELVAYTTFDCSSTHFDNTFLPLKLLLPSVMGADPKHYMEIRVLMLFFMGNLFYHGKSDQLFFNNGYRLTNFNKILDYWSRMNLNYSDQLLIDNCQNKAGSSQNIYEYMMGSTPRLSLFKHFVRYIFSQKKFRLSAYEMGNTTVLE